MSYLFLNLELHSSRESDFIARGRNRKTEVRNTNLQNVFGMGEFHSLTILRKIEECLMDLSPLRRNF